MLYSWTIGGLPKIPETSQPLWDIDVAKQCGFAATDLKSSNFRSRSGQDLPRPKTVRALLKSALQMLIVAIESSNASRGNLPS